MGFINGEVYEQATNLTGTDLKNELLVFRMNNDSKTFWSINVSDLNLSIAQRWSNQTGGDDVFANVVIGKPTVSTTEGGAYNVSEVLCFNGALTNTAIGEIRTFLLKYYSNKLT